jgi:hypothetical protein
MLRYCKDPVNRSKVVELIGAKTEEDMKSQITLYRSNNTYGQSVPRTKRKLLNDQFDSMDNKDQNMCVKKLNNEYSLEAESSGLPTRLEVVVFNGKWDTSQTFHSTITENNVDLQNVAVVNECCVPWSESNGTEISMEEDNRIFKHCSQSSPCTDSDVDLSVDSCSVSGEPAPLTTFSDTEPEHINDAENNCDKNLSWLINFKVGSLFNADEVDHDHTYQGREDEEITFPGMC